MGRRIQRFIDKAIRPALWVAGMDSTGKKEEMTIDNKGPERNSGGSGFLGFLIGSVVGAVTMLFIAPQSGKQTREELSQGTQKLRDQANQTIKVRSAQVKEKAQEVSAEARRKVEDLKQQGKDLALQGLDRVSDAAEAGKKAIKGSGNGKDE